MKLDRETGVVSVQVRSAAAARDLDKAAAREVDKAAPLAVEAGGTVEGQSGGVAPGGTPASARERAPSSPVPLPSAPPVHTPASGKLKPKKRASVLNGMRANLANRMLRLASEARTKIMVNGLEKSLAVSSTIVAVRMRPANRKEKVLDAPSVFSSTAKPELERNTVCRVGKRAFTYDVVIGPRTSQADARNKFDVGS